MDLAGDFPGNTFPYGLNILISEADRLDVFVIVVRFLKIDVEKGLGGSMPLGLFSACSESRLRISERYLLMCIQFSDVNFALDLSEGAMFKSLWHRWGRAGCRLFLFPSRELL